MSPPIHEAKDENVITYSTLCKAIATLVIIARMLDSNNNNSKVFIHQEIKIHIFWKRFLVKTFAILAEPS